MKYLFIFFIFSFVNFSAVMAQDPYENCEKALAFFNSFKGDCISSMSAHNCIHLDVTDSYDFEGKEFLFQWNMGDGTLLEGMDIYHCYDNPGNYEATLSLLDPMTKAIIENEATVNVVIKGAFKLGMTPVETGIAKEPLILNYNLTYPENTYQIEDVFWYFDDGSFSCETSPQHVFSSPGNYKVRQFVTLSSGKDIQTLCTSEVVKVGNADPSFGMLSVVFDKTSIASRFLADDIHYKILTKEGGQFIENINQDSLTGGLVYKILAYRGDLLFSSSEIAADANDDNNKIMELINSEAKLLAQSEPIQINSLIFELDQDDLSGKNKKLLKKNIELLEQFPMIQLAIGVYTNSKGSLERGVKLSIERGKLIKDYMIKNGIDGNRLLIINPNDNRSLINSCLTGAACDYADPDLDRRADFKILSDLVN